MRRVVLIALSVAVIVACGDAPGGAAGFRVTDSAGVAIATNALPPDSAPEWTLAAQPTVDIGGEGLSSVLGGARLSNGGIVVLNASNQVRFYGADGRHIRSVGSTGRAPGEYQAARALWRRGDSVVVWDPQLLRFTWLTSDGTTAGTVRLDGGAFNPIAVGMFGDGSYLVQDELFQMPTLGAADVQLHVTRYTALGSIAAQLPRVIHTRVGMLDADEGLMGRPLFEPVTTVAVTRDAYWVGTGRQYELVARDMSGKAVRIVRWSGPDRTVDRSATETANAAELAAADEAAKARTRRMQAVRAVAAEFPAYDEILANPSGEIWVRAYRRPGADGPDRWLVFSVDGQCIAHLTTPRAMRVLDAGANYMLGSVVNDTGSEHVRLYSLQRAAAR